MRWCIGSTTRTGTSRCWTSMPRTGEVKAALTERGYGVRTIQEYH
jgi:hypothetical protein